MTRRIIVPVIGAEANVRMRPEKVGFDFGVVTLTDAFLAVMQYRVGLARGLWENDGSVGEIRFRGLYCLFISERALCAEGSELPSFAEESRATSQPVDVPEDFRIDDSNYQTVRWDEVALSLDSAGNIEVVFEAITADSHLRIFTAGIPVQDMFTPPRPGVVALVEDRRASLHKIMARQQQLKSVCIAGMQPVYEAVKALQQHYHGFLADQPRWADREILPDPDDTLNVYEGSDGIRIHTCVDTDGRMLWVCRDTLDLADGVAAVAQSQKFIAGEDAIRWLAGRLAERLVSYGYGEAAGDTHEVRNP